MQLKVNSIQTDRQKRNNMVQLTLQEIKDLAERMWEGCHGCDETDKQMWINGFVMGYLTAYNETYGKSI